MGQGPVRQSSSVTQRTLTMRSCMKCQYGRVSFDRSQRFVVNYSYDLPFGKGTTGITNKLIGGWNVSGVTIAQTGDPLTFIGVRAHRHGLRHQHHKLSDRTRLA